MRTSRWIAGGGLLALGAAAVFALVALRPEVERAPEPPAPPRVRTVEVAPQDVQVVVRSQGQTQPATQSQLVAQVGARVVRVAPQFAAGAFFERGDVLLWLDDADYRLALEQAEAQVAQARVALAQEQAQAEVAREEWRALGRGPPSPLVLRVPQLEQARAALAAAQAAAGQARLQLQRTAVRAPYAGRVRATQVGVGQSVSPGSVLATLYATGHAEVRLPVSQRELAFLPLDMGYPALRRDGPAVTLHAAGRSWHGRVVRVGGTVDPQTRLVDVWARVDDPFNRSRDAGRAPLAIGQFVQAEVVGRTLEGVFVVPRAALHEGRLRVVQDGRLVLRDTNVVHERADELIVDRGLAAGDVLVVSPLDTPVDGMALRPEAAP